MLIVAMSLAPMATLTPFIYVQIAAAATFTWLVFDHLPDAWGWVGMAVIAVCARPARGSMCAARAASLP